MLVTTRQTFLRSNSARISAARIGVSPPVMKITSAASRFFALNGVSFSPPLLALKTMRAVAVADPEIPGDQSSAEVERILHRKPGTLKQFIKDYRAAFQA
jgi:hypothetical protein